MAWGIGHTAGMAPEYTVGEVEMAKPTTVGVAELTNALKTDKSIIKRLSPGSGGSGTVALNLPHKWLGRKSFLGKVFAALNSSPEVAMMYKAEINGNQLIIEGTPGTRNVNTEAADYANALSKRTATNEIDRAAFRAHVIDEINTNAKGSALATNLDKDEDQRAIFANSLLDNFVTKLKEATKKQIELRDKKAGLFGKIRKNKVARYSTKLAKGLGFVGLTALGGASSGGLMIASHLGAGLLGRKTALNFMDARRKGAEGVAMEVNNLVRNSVGDTVNFKNFDNIMNNWRDNIMDGARNIGKGTTMTNEAIRYNIAHNVMKETDAVFAHLNDKAGFMSKQLRNVLAISGAAGASFLLGAAAKDFGVLNKVEPVSNWISDTNIAAYNWTADKIGGINGDSISHAWDSATDWLGSHAGRMGSGVY